MIGLDIGDARTGVAVSDELGMVATALDTVQMSEPAADALAIALCCLQDVKREALVP